MSQEAGSDIGIGALNRMVFHGTLETSAGHFQSCLCSEELIVAKQNQ
jgi:hypothetical protein